MALTRTGYGYGWAISEFRESPEISHSGGVPGFSSFLLRLPRERFTVVVLANAQPGPRGRDPGQLAHLAASIFPKSPTEFFWKVVAAQVEFVKDEKGKVVKVIHRQDGQTIEAPKLGY